MDAKDKESVRYRTELLRLSVVGLLTIGGGVVSLIVDRQSSGGKSFFIAFGIVLLVGLVTCVFNIHGSIKQTIK